MYTDKYYVKVISPTSNFVYTLLLANTIFKNNIKIINDNV